MAGDDETPHAAYYAVIFTSRRPPGGADDGYEDVAERMAKLATGQPGYLGMDSVRAADGHGITVSYWSSLADIRAWKAVEEHRAAQREGRARWYDAYHVRVARVEYEYGTEA